MIKKKGYLIVEVFIWISFSCLMMIFIPPIVTSFNNLKLKLCTNEVVMNIRNAQGMAINGHRTCNIKFINTEEESCYYVYHTIEKSKKFVLPDGIRFNFKTGANLMISYNSEGHPTKGDSFDVINGKDTYIIAINPNVGRVVMRKC